MSEKIIVLIIVIILIVILGAIYFITQNLSEDVNDVNKVQENTETEENNNTAVDENSTSNGNNILVIYFSAQGHTEKIAQIIANNLGADIFEIVPVDEYTSDDLDWTDDNSRTSLEYEDETLRNVELISNIVDNWEEYDTVFIGYPIWWGTAAWPTTSFVSVNDFTGKTVIPFCTSSSSGVGSSVEVLTEAAENGNWLDGQRFSGNASESDVIEWLNSLGI